jgi:dTDP-4-amino-4,6-dideoxygalactose transaminase
MNVPLLDLRPQYEALKGEIDQAVQEVLASTQYIMGPKVDQLEAEVAAYTGVKHGIGVSSGTDALLLSLMALDVEPADLVLTTTYSFFATAGAISRLNAIPVLLDIDPKTYNIDPDAIRVWLVDNADKITRVKAIIPVHLYGQVADMDPICEIASEHRIPIIEDAAQAIGATYPSKNGSKKAGSMGLAGCFSFFPSKNLGGIGDGGMITTNDDAFAEKLRVLRNHGMQPKYHHQQIGGNFRLDPIQAAVLSVKLPHLDSWHNGRRRNAEHYDGKLNAHGMQTPHIAYSRDDNIYNQYTLSLPNESECGKSREQLREHLASHAVGHDIYYPISFHEQPCFEYLEYSTGDFPNAERAASSTIALPIYPDLTTEQLDYVIETLIQFYK